MEGYIRYVRGKVTFTSLLFLLLLILSLFSLSSGSADASIQEVASALFKKGSEKMNTIIWNVRLPRLFAALVVGCALASSGAVIESVLQNQLASSSTLGITQGASFGAAFAIIFLGGGGLYTVSFFAFLGGLATTFLILALSRIKLATPSTIALAGVAISAMFSSATTLLEYFANDVEVASVVYWTFGNLGRAGWREIGIMTFVAVVSFAFFFINSLNYNALEWGEDGARSLGVDTSVLVPLSLVLTSLSVSSQVAFTGCINFIGLIAPHAMRRFVGSDYRFLIPASAMAGALILLLSDIVCRTLLSPVVLPVGALTSLLGAPLFLYLVFRERRRG